MPTSERIPALQAAMVDRSVDLVVVGPSANMRYLVGYRALAVDRITVLLVTTDAVAMVIPYFDADEFRDVTGLDGVFEWADKQGAGSAIEKAFRAVGAPANPVTAVDDELRFDFLTQLRHRLGEDPIRASEILAPLRMAKDPTELALIRKAGELVSIGIDTAFQYAQRGMTELELKRTIESVLFESGAESVDFLLVQAGPNAVAAHHKADGTRFRDGESVLIDIAATVDGYFADITQQAFLGDPPLEYREAYEAVAAAQEAGVRASRSGAAAGDVDRAAFSVLEAAGFAQWAGPRTGHSIGLDVHEPPALMDGDETELMPGLVVTVEPGIYKPGHFGIRIEDTVIVSDDEPERATRGARPLFVK
jgi:Xaa-Pro aminopeptidase